MARTKRRKQGAPARGARLNRYGALAGRGAIDLAIFARETAAGRNWGHTGLAGVLRGIGLDEATWKATPQTFSIWEEVNHIHYW